MKKYTLVFVLSILLDKTSRGLVESLPESVIWSDTLVKFFGTIESENWISNFCSNLWKNLDSILRGLLSFSFGTEEAVPEVVGEDDVDGGS